MRRFRSIRAQTLDFVRSLTPEQWCRQGLFWGQPRSLVDLGTWLANHDPGHLAQVRRQCEVRD